MCGCVSVSAGGRSALSSRRSARVSARGWEGRAGPSHLAFPSASRSRHRPWPPALRSPEPASARGGGRVGEPRRAAVRAKAALPPSCASAERAAPVRRQAGRGHVSGEPPVTPRGRRRAGPGWRRRGSSAALAGAGGREEAAFGPTCERGPWGKQCQPAVVRSVESPVPEVTTVARPAAAPFAVRDGGKWSGFERCFAEIPLPSAALWQGSSLSHTPARIGTLSTTCQRWGGVPHLKT